MKAALNPAQRPVIADAAFDWVPRSLYVHIPFCKSRCFYCDFTTHVAPKARIESYVSALEQEFALLATQAAEPLRTVFFGGGTPTLLSSEQLKRVLTALRGHFALAESAEVTMEANPGTLDAQKLQVLSEFGVNRLSIGGQTFNDRLLLALGRTHEAKTTLSSVELAKDAGFKRINVDLMFGLPEQSLQDVEESVSALVSSDVEHISAYWLKVEEGTPFAKWKQSGALVLPGEDLEGEMYSRVREMLRQSGYEHYEVSNFAKPGGQAEHNLVYWRNEPYFAAGVGSHGYVQGVRYENVKQLALYEQQLANGERPIREQFNVTAGEACEDTMMLGLRLAEGVDKHRFRARHGADLEQVFGSVISPLLTKGLLEWHGPRLCLTEQAWPIGNLVFEEFVGTGLTTGLVD